MTYHRYIAPGFGVGEVWVEDSVLVLHELAGTVPGVEQDVQALQPAARDATGQDGGGALIAFPPKGGTRAPTETVRAGSSREGNGFVPDLCRRFASHLTGTATGYVDVTIDDSGLTLFQRELLHALRAIPWGDVVTYGELAAIAGRPRAHRAAGTFCAENQFSLVVPCHRVVASDGIGGYGSAGVELKRRLLRLEGVEL